MIPYGRQSIDDEDIRAVVDVLSSDWLTCGSKVTDFERGLAHYCGATHAVAVSSGTAALHVAMLAAGVGPGGRALTSANTFLASANCAEFVGATADFSDIDSQTYNVTAETLRASWKDDVRAVIPVDFAGQPCDTPPIAALARERGAIVVEDASHAIGSRFQHEGKWYKVGGHPWADMTTFSFHPVKTITTGEGGAIVTNSDEFAERCRLFRNHGMMKPQTTDNGARTNTCESWLSELGPWWCEMHEVGFNYRITDIQCALGLSQLKKLDRFIARRQEIVDRYNAAFADVSSVLCPPSSDSVRPAWHLYVLKINFKDVGKTRAQVMHALEDHGVGTQVHYIPVHLQPYYRNKYGYGTGKCPVAETYYESCLSLPLYPAMTDGDIDRVVAGVCDVVCS